MFKCIDGYINRYITQLLIAMLLSGLSGCTQISNIKTYFVNFQEGLQRQKVDEFAQRSVNFQPQYEFNQPKREELSAGEQRLVGAPPPPKGVALLDGTRYYSANGHVCQLFKDTRYQSPVGSKSACFIDGRWVLAAPVLNTRQAKP